ncbi:MAG: acetyl-CoA carboxylase biotin carboxyl carrier protein [Isosphaeraceae bacterium]
MSDKPNEPPGADDLQVRRIRQLVRLMQRFDLTAIDLDDTATRIKLRRRGAEVVAVPATIAAAPAPASAPQPAAAAPPAAPPASSSPKVFIESPMVGTFYPSPAPDAPPFVQVGSAVRQDTTVCIIEAMKVFTDIPAGIGGTIVEVLAKSGQPVEFGQPLFRIEPA